MKIFISQPMANKSNGYIQQERNILISKAKERFGKDIDVIDSFFKDAPHEANPLWFLGKSIELLSTADVVYFSKDWESARGCCIEHECAMRYGFDFIECYDY